MKQALLFALVLLACQFNSVQAEARTFTITKVRIFDGRSVIPRGTVAVADGRIAAVGADVTPPPGAGSDRRLRRHPSPRLHRLAHPHLRRRFKGTAEPTI